VILLIAIALAPAIAPELLPTAAAGMIVVALAAQALLGTRWGAALALACLVTLMVDSLIVQSALSGLSNAASSRDFAQSGSVLVGNLLAILGFILVGREILIGYEGALAEDHSTLRL